MATQKILYLVTQSESGGAQKYLVDLAKNLKNDCQILVAAGEGDGSLFSALKQENIRTCRLKFLKRNINPVYDALAFLEIKKLIKREKPDIIHLNSSKISILGSLAATFNNNQSTNNKPCPDLSATRSRPSGRSRGKQTTNIIYTVHGWVFNEPMSFWKKRLYLYLERLTAKYKDKIICVSEKDKQIALDNKICSPEKLITIHNGIDTADLQFYVQNEARNYLIPHSSFLIPHSIIGTIANLYKTKGLEYLVAAAKNVIKNFPNTVFMVIGDGPEKAALKRQIESLNLTANFFLLGKIAEAFKYLKAFDIFALPSVKEGLPYGVLEAQAARLPVIASDVGGLPEIIKNGENGLLVEPGRPDLLASAIIKLLSDEPLKNRLIENINLRDFSLVEMVSKTKVLYHLSVRNP